MSPERSDSSGVKYDKNGSLGVPEIVVCSTCRFLPDDTKIRVGVSMNGRHMEGWLIGVMEEPAPGAGTYQILVDDKSTIHFVHNNWIKRK